ncbi:diguanylate cyclase [Photobacterium aquae]|uniref:diguanylate cyclase n=1 Tax=Photobacterium aquae TaxID=1195763 RepID=A0A0J1H634_9GAMM|nr:diguanylate cyclase [Photobacterium aquae]
MDRLRLRLRYTAYILLSFSFFSYLFYMLGGFNKEFVVSAKNAAFSSIDDTTQGGDTQTYLDIDGESIVLNCELGKAGQWPFCEIAINFTNIARGIDLSTYHSVGIDVDYFSPVDDERIRVYLRNYDPSYSSENDPISLKFNAIEYAPGAGNGLLVIPMDSFQVLSWWIAEYAIPIEKAGPEFSQIQTIEIATGSFVKPTNYTIRLNKLVFYGQWISESTLLRINMMLWISAAVVFLYFERRRLNFQLQQVVAKADFLKDANKNLYQKSMKFEELAFTDNLTGTQNRHAVDSWLSEILDFSRLNCHSFSIIYIDIDHFKRINDQFGHHCGDEVLKEFGRVLNLRARKTDVVVRWGGEEFIIFCPATNLRSAQEFAEQLRNIVEHYHWSLGTTITCSLGVAEYRIDESVDEFISRADSALYLAKEQGRNRVEISPVS